MLRELRPLRKTARCGYPSTRSPVPPLFRQTPITNGKQREPTSSETAGQTA